MSAEAQTIPVHLTATHWWRPCTIQITGAGPAATPVMRSLLAQLTASFEDHGHTVVAQSHGGVDVLLMPVSIPDGPQPLADRIVEQTPPLSVAVCQANGLIIGSRLVVAVAEIPEHLSGMPHAQVVATARTAMARMAVARVLFVTRGSQPGEVAEATLCTMEGGHPTETHDIARGICDRLIAAACAREIGDAYDVIEGAVSAEAWESSPAPQCLAAAGHRMAGMSLLPPPVALDEFVSETLAEMYRAYLGWKRLSEGMLFLYDPGLDAIVLTASGKWDVDKRSLHRDDVVIVDAHGTGPLRVLTPQGISCKGPSVEAWEVRAMLQAAPRVRVRQSPDGIWRQDPAGDREVPAIRAGIHAHVGVQWADDAVIETVSPDRARYPFGFGCGTDLTSELAAHTVRRSSAINSSDDERVYVRWPMLYHGEMAVELWKPGIPDAPLDGLLDVYAASVTYTPDHVDQPR